MTIIRDGRNSSVAKDFVIVGVGGGGSESATELSKVLGSPDDVIAVDREMESLRSVNVGRRISIGYPIFVSNEDGMRDEDLADSSDLFRLKTVIGKPPIVFVMAGLGGATTLELMSSVLRTAMSTGASVLAIVTLPFAFEGRSRVNTAEMALERIRETGCSLALIDADKALSNLSLAGDLASELAAAKARVVMNVLSASDAASLGTLNTAPELLDAIKCGGETFISYASADDASDYRKVAREAIKHPITTGLDLGDADYVSIIVAGPRDLSIKTLNAAISIVQNETSAKAVLSTSFVPNRDPARVARLRISILAGRRAEPQMAIFANERVAGTAEAEYRDEGRQEVSLEVGAIVNEGDDLFGAPDWLVDRPRERNSVPALL